MSKILVTGVNGFVGEHLARELSSRGIEVIGAGLDAAASSELDGFISQYYTCDLTSEADVARLPLSDIDAVISLAGLASVQDSFGKSELYQQVNVAVLSVIGNKLLELQSKARVIAVSTGAVYESHQPMPLSEDSTLVTDGSPYALSKIAMEKEADALRERGLDCRVVRPFNHIGPGQKGGFLVPDLYSKIQAASQSGGPMAVGDLTTRRDYTDVRDVVRAYADLATAASLQNTLYNVCSERSVAGQTILELLLKATGQTEKITVTQDPALIRPNDPTDLYGNSQRLSSETGWHPIVPIEQTISDFVASQQ